MHASMMNWKKTLWIERIIYIILFLLIAYAISHMAYVNPIHSDDYLYCCVWNEYARITSWGDVWRSQLEQYGSLNGRVIANTALQVVLLQNRLVFVCLNTAFFVLCVWSICRLSRQVNTFTLLFVALIFVRVVPYTIWASGSVTYLWMSGIMLCFLLLLFSENHKAHLAALLLAFPAGNCHEALSAGALAAMFLFGLTERSRMKDGYYIGTFVLLLLGFVSNALAPATFVRMSNARTTLPYDSTATALFVQIQVLVYNFLFLLKSTPHMALLLVFGIGTTLFQLFTKRYNRLSLAFMGAAAVSTLLAFAANAIYPAALYGMCFYLMLAVSVLLLPRCSPDHCTPFWGGMLRILLVGWLFCPLMPIYRWVITGSATMDRIENYVAEQVRSGVRNIEIPVELRDGPGSSVFGNFNDCTRNLYAAVYHGGAPFAVFKSEEEIAILHDDSCFIGLEPGQWRRLPYQRMLYALAARPKKVECLFAPDESYKRPGKQGEWLSKDVQKMPCKINPAVFERDEKFYVMLPILRDPGEVSLSIEYVEAGLSSETCKMPHS